MREGKDGLAIGLHNLSNPMMKKGPTREVYPVGRQELSIAIPAGKTFAAARLLVAGTAAETKASGDRVTVTVPGIDQLEVVHLTWA